MKFFFVIGFLFLNNFCKGVILDSKTKLVAAIDVGSTIPTQSQSGLQYSKDQYYSFNTHVADYILNPNYENIQIKYTNDPVIFKTERHSKDSFEYHIPIEQDGKHVLILQFCELYFKKAHQRKINVLIGSKVVIENLDIVERVGFMAALQVYVEFEIKQKKLYWNNQLIEDGFENGKINIVFQKTNFDLPKVDGIIIVKGGLKDTDYDDYNELVKNWDEKIKEEKRNRELERQRLEQKRKNMILEDDDAYLDIYQSRSIIDDIIHLLTTTPVGYAILGILVGFIIIMRVLDRNGAQKEKEKNN